jgi:predicted DNA-binding WGR domain protein
MSGRIVKTSAVHEGGTKFYQIIAIRSLDEKRSVLVTHWGKYPGRIPDPTWGGQRKVQVFSNPNEAFVALDRQRSVKRARGYGRGSGGWVTSDIKPLNAKQLESVLDIFLHKDRKSIQEHLGFNEVVAPDPTPPDNHASKRQPKEEKINRGVEWGSW